MKDIVRATILVVCLMTGCTSTAPAHEPSRPKGEADRPIARVEEMLKYYPGVRVIDRGSGFQVRIRGSLREPLYIVDGLALEAQPGGTLVDLNPSDIEKIEVLTDAADMTFYGGARGAAGVVRITTKRGGHR